MTGRDPLAVWNWAHFAGFRTDEAAAKAEGANVRLDALRPLIDAAADLADAVLFVRVGGAIHPLDLAEKARIVRDLTTPKEGTPT